jgi:hypothetical protein
MVYYTWIGRTSIRMLALPSGLTAQIINRPRRVRRQASYMHGRSAVINLDTTSMERILTFAGYGNPAGPLWFIGKEEGLSQMDSADQDANLIARGRFHQVMDVQAAHLTLREGGKPYDLTKRQSFTQVWVWEAKFARALGGATDWQDVERAKDYIRTRLARADGQTFITNVSPIPEKGGATQRKWRQYFEDRLPPGMLDALLGQRRRMLRDLISAHQRRLFAMVSLGQITARWCFPA